jgi:hypothetical protein
VSAALTLAEKVLAIDREIAKLPHAFGGAIALAYYAEPRTTVDIDLNIFVPEAEARRAIAPLQGLGIRASEDSVAHAMRDGQVRLYWDATPVDLFFSYDAFHDAAARAVRRVPFAGSTIPILAANHLVVCKAVFDRPKDWIDIQQMIENGTKLDSPEIIRWVQRIAGDEDPRFERVVEILTGR